MRRSLPRVAGGCRARVHGADDGWRAARCTTHDDAELSRARRRSICLAAIDRVAPYTVPMKAVLQQCCTLGRVRPAPLARSPRMHMDRSARLFLCARCRDQVLLCSHCDRGQQYCSRACSSVSRRERRRETAERYQSSRGGQLRHAARSARWRQRRRSPRQVNAGMDIDKVTHQGCLDAPADASLLACDTPSVSEDSIDSESSADDTTAASAGAVGLAALVCRRCAHPLRPHVRQGHWRPFSARSRHAHDHRPGAGRAH
jgi:hypothetical protein